MNSLAGPPAHEERNRLILRRSLSAVSHLYGLFGALVGWSLWMRPPHGAGVHGSRFIGTYSLLQAALYIAAGWMVWRPRRGAWLLVLAAAAASSALAFLDFLGGRMQSLPVDGLYALVALALWLQARPRP
ncbi:MAG TPA: hypothetical protein VJB14_03480 [Planctomycetota bacterium]|nr:hypothetical protein [Planctomycetota bacterium]